MFYVPTSEPYSQTNPIVLATCTTGCLLSNTLADSMRGIATEILLEMVCVLSEWLHQVACQSCTLMIL